MKILLSILLSLTIGFIAPVHAEGPAEDTLDIAGIKIGMTEAEAEAALKAFDPEIEITTFMAAFNLSDGANLVKSPEFLDRIEGSIGNSGPLFYVYFSGPVEEVRVIGISRSGILINNRPTAEQFMNSLISKYGQPTGVNNNNKSQPVWEVADKPSCVRVRDYKNEVIINISPNMGQSMMINANTEQILAGLIGNNSAKGLIPEDVTQCGAFLSYNLHGDPVSSFGAELFDLGKLVMIDRSRAAWADQLEEEAIQKRIGQGQAPKL